MPSTLRLLGCLVLALALLGCQRTVNEPSFTGTDITGADFGRQLALTDHHLRPVTLKTFQGRLVVLFFGYTHCPDVCPTTLSDMDAALKSMPPEAAAKVQVLFVTVDPERDTPEVLKAYVPYFNPTFLGLFGSESEVARVAKEFRIVYRRHVEPGASGYLVDHSAGSYVLDGQGRLRLYLPYGHPAADIAADLLALLEAGAA